MTTEYEADYAEEALARFQRSKDKIINILKEDFGCLLNTKDFNLMIDGVNEAIDEALYDEVSEQKAIISAFESFSEMRHERQESTVSL